jgi:hypothetical protein
MDNGALTSNSRDAAGDPAPAGAAEPRRASPVILVLAALVVVGIAARFALSWISLGSNDWGTWHWFATLVLISGPKVYVFDASINHPLIPLIWSGIALALSAIPIGASFAFWFRIPAVLADVGSCILLKRIWTTRTNDRRWGWAAAAAMAWNLDAIMIGAYHCNTDSICAFLALLSAYLLDRRRPLGAGLALAAAINVKLVPVLLIPALLSATGGWRGGLRFLGGLACGALPFLIPWLMVREAFVHNVLSYNPLIGEWGIMFFGMHWNDLPVTAHKALLATQWYVANGKRVVLAAAVLVGLISLIRPRWWSVYDRTALGLVLFLVLAPGFGFQYTVYAAPLLLAVDLRRGMIYGLVAGLYVLTAYAGAWDGTLPIETMFSGRPNGLPVPLGLVAWAVLVEFVVDRLLPRRWRAGGGTTRSFEVKIAATPDVQTHATTPEDPPVVKTDAAAFA